MNNRRKRTQARSPLFMLLRGGCIGALGGMLSALPLSLLAAAICYACDDPLSATLPAAITVLYLSSLICGGLSATLSHDTPLASGAVGGGLWMLLSLLPSLLPASPSSLPKAWAILLRMLIPLFSLLGAYIVTRHRSSSKRRWRR